MPSLDSDAVHAADREWQVLARRVRLAKGFCFVVYFSLDSGAANDIMLRLEHYARGRGAGFAMIRQMSADTLVQQVIGAIYSNSTILSSVSQRPVVWVDCASGADQPGWREAVADLLMRLNEQRSRLENEVAGVLVLLLPPGYLDLVGTLAPDLWHIRSHSANIGPTLFDIDESVVVDDAISGSSGEIRLRALVQATDEVIAIDPAWPVHPPLLSGGASQWIAPPLEDWMDHVDSPELGQDLRRIRHCLRYGKLKAARIALLSIQAETGSLAADSNARRRSTSVLKFFEGLLALEEGGSEFALRHFMHCGAICKSQGDIVGQFVAMDRACTTLLALGRRDDARYAQEVASNLAERLRGRTVEAVCLSRLGEIYRAESQYERMRSILDRATGLFMRDGNWRATVVTLCDSAFAATCAFEQSSGVEEAEALPAVPSLVSESELGLMVRAEGSIAAKELSANAERIIRQYPDDYSALAMYTWKESELLLSRRSRGAKDALKSLDALKAMLIGEEVPGVTVSDGYRQALGDLDVVEDRTGGIRTARSRTPRARGHRREVDEDVRATPASRARAILLGSTDALRTLANSLMGEFAEAHLALVECRQLAKARDDESLIRIVNRLDIEVSTSWRRGPGSE